MKKSIFLLLSAILPLSFEASAISFEPHFVIAKTAQKSTQNPLVLKGDDLGVCRENIRKVICLVEPDDYDQADPATRQCLMGGEDYAVRFERLFDHSPPALQRMYCSLRYLFIEKQFVGTAYAGLVKSPDGKNAGAMMGVRQSVLDQNLDLTTWATWKEQLSFGGNPSDSYIATPDLQLIQTTSKSGANDFLYFVVAHEFGHIFDFANQLNRITICHGAPMEQDPACDLSPESWGSISWTNTKTPKSENDFRGRVNLCFYWCEGSGVQKDGITGLYYQFSQTDFISLYGTRQPWDDFADSLAYFLMDQNLETTYVIDTQKGILWDIMAKLHSEKFKKKFDYIENFLNRTDIVYP